MGASRRRGPLGKLWSPLTGDFKRQLVGYGKGASISVGALLRGLLSGDPDGYGEEGSGDGYHPMGVHSLGTLRDSCKGASPYLYGNSVRGTWRVGSFVRGHEGYKRKGLGMGIPIYVVQLGNLEWAHLPGTLRNG